MAQRRRRADQSPEPETRSGPLFARNAVTVTIKAVDVVSDHGDGTRNIGRAVSAATGAVDIAGDGGDAGARVIGVAG